MDILAYVFWWMDICVHFLEVYFLEHRADVCLALLDNAKLLYYINLHFHQQCMRAPAASHPWQNLVWPVF